MTLFGSLKGSWYLGKGSRAFKNGRYDQALGYFLSALKYAQETESSGELAVRKEAIAETYLKLGNYDKARLYASESLGIYEEFFSKDKSDVFKQAVNRVNRLLEEISNKVPFYIQLVFKQPCCDAKV
jgi:tetratricopeptide (TPR) repeat protein